MRFDGSNDVRLFFSDDGSYDSVLVDGHYPGHYDYEQGYLHDSGVVTRDTGLNYYKVVKQIKLHCDIHYSYVRTTYFSFGTDDDYVLDYIEHGKCGVSYVNVHELRQDARVDGCLLRLRSGLRQTWHLLRRCQGMPARSLRRPRLPVQGLRVRLPELDALLHQAEWQIHQDEGARIHRVLTHRGQAHHRGVNDLVSVRILDEFFRLRSMWKTFLPRSNVNR